MMNKLAALGLLVVVAVFAVGCASETTEEKQGSTTSNIVGGDEEETPQEEERDQPEAAGDDAEYQEASWRDWQRCMDRTSGADCDRALEL